MPKARRSPRMMNAIKAMKPLGVSEGKVETVVKDLLKLYFNNWELIESENYRALADVIFDEKETKVRPKKKIVKPTKKTMDSEVVGEHSMSIFCCEEEKETEEEEEMEMLVRRSKTKRVEYGNDRYPPSELPNNEVTPLAITNVSEEQVELNPENTWIESHPVTMSKSPGRSMTKKHLIPAQSLNVPDIALESESIKHPMRLRGRGKGSVTESSVNAECVIELKGVPNPFSRPIPKRKRSLALIQLYKDDNDGLLETPLAVIHPGASYASERETVEYTSSLSEQRKKGKTVNISDASSSKRDMASSPFVRMEAALSCESPLQLPHLEAFLKSLEDKCLESYKISDPNFSLIKAAKEMFLKHESESKSRSSETTGKTIDPTSVSLMPNDLSSMVVQQPKMTSEMFIHVQELDISKGRENVAITVVNEVNADSIPSFIYISENAFFSKKTDVYLTLDSLGDNKCYCTCSGDCISLVLPCACATGGEYAYTKDGLVSEDFLDECVSSAHKGLLAKKFIKECWMNCGCNKQCGNRIVQRGISRNLQVFMTSEQKGWGLRTLVNLPKGAFVCEYVGEVLTNKEFFGRVSRKANGETYSHPVLLDAGLRADGVMKNKGGLALDSTRYGNIARFINHRCHDSNLVEVPVEVDTPDHRYYRIALFTTRNVKPMEELTWDYGIDFNDQDNRFKAFKCQCGSNFCRNLKCFRAKGVVNRSRSNH